MNYFILKYTNDMPDKFGGETRGPLISIRPKYSADVGLIEHEKTHVRQWYVVLALGLLLCTLLTLLVSPSLWPMYGLAPFLHQLLYKLVRVYRRWCEVRAYRKQIATGGYASNEFAVSALVDKYGLRLSREEARALLID
ncbi:hypothetical protein QN377_05095 [Pseudomonas sp. CCC4.1]|uniref:hypothetical protein n=1 Tax=Pseudomonas sp. CCC4.1 TaxID=3048610 RepID=UPI002AB5A579|nr:hypothetical protein [Pseudomonas sp. CCC4.1]MDY7569417.1 hypothetical protein [Pseudomonas sp. CCC4.1]MEB0142501.1 hypothetical protein [Pseudomonas sp. CCC4.1]